MLNLSISMQSKESLISYAAFLRGIGPGDPRKSNESLRKVFESCGFKNVSSFISSGNILFESKETDKAKLERKAEKAFKETGIEIPTFIRNKDEIGRFLKEVSFGDRVHSQKSYLLITFLREKQDVAKITPLLKDKTSGLLSYNKKINAVCSTVDASSTKTPDFMGKLEKLLSKEITSRTLNTVERLSKRL
jgi:uncharacterized protein (DUF1697 family)